MNHNAKTFSHEQLAQWLNEGLDLAQIGLAVFDTGGNTIFENKLCRSLGGCPFHNGRSHIDSDFSGSSSSVREDVVHIGKQRWTKTVRRVFPDNTAICTCINLSDLKLAEFAQSENERKYRLLADNTLDVIWLMDMDLMFSYVNPSVKQMLGFTAEEWIGSSLSDHCTPFEMQRMSKIVIQAMERGEKRPWVLFETELLNKKIHLFR